MQSLHLSPPPSHFVHLSRLDRTRRPLLLLGLDSRFASSPSSPFPPPLILTPYPNLSTTRFRRRAGLRPPWPSLLHERWLHQRRAHVPAPRRRSRARLDRLGLHHRFNPFGLPLHAGSRGEVERSVWRMGWRRNCAGEGQG